MAAYNIALYHEMTDDIDAALHSLYIAEALATEKGRRRKGEGESIDTSLLQQYREVLKTRLQEIEKIDQYLRLTK